MGSIRLQHLFKGVNHYVVEGSRAAGEILVMVLAGEEEGEKEGEVIRYGEKKEQ